MKIWSKPEVVECDIKKTENDELNLDGFGHGPGCHCPKCHPVECLS